MLFAGTGCRQQLTKYGTCLFRLSDRRGVPSMVKWTRSDHCSRGHLMSVSLSALAVSESSPQSAQRTDDRLASQTTSIARKLRLSTLNGAATKSYESFIVCAHSRSDESHVVR